MVGMFSDLLIRECGYYARQSIAALSVSDGLFADMRIAPLGTTQHPNGPRASRHDSFTASQDRRSDSRYRAQDLGPDEQQLPAAKSVRPGSPAVTLLISCGPSVAIVL
jgi:hypothetical protein